MSGSYVDRRGAMRYPVNTGTTCPMVAPVTQDFGEARIKDVSNEGIGLVLGHPVEAGTVLMVTLKNEAKKFFRIQLVEVVHSTQQAGGGYLIGGTFITPLTYEELSTLLL